MNILIFGRDVIGTQYGWALEKAGHSVDFYVRRGRAAEYGPFVDLDIYDLRPSVRGVRVRERWAIRFIEQIPFDHHYDVIILSVPHHRFAEAAAYLGPRAGNASILVFNNFWEEPLEAAAALSEPQLVWGFPGAGGGFDGTVLRGGFFKSVQFGTFNAELTGKERTRLALDPFRAERGSSRTGAAGGIDRRNDELRLPGARGRAKRARGARRARGTRRRPQAVCEGCVDLPVADLDRRIGA